MIRLRANHNKLSVLNNYNVLFEYKKRAYLIAFTSLLVVDGSARAMVDCISIDVDSFDVELQVSLLTNNLA